MMLARITSSGALSEFLVNPIFGRLMDTHGRKPFLVGALLASSGAYMLAFLNADKVAELSTAAPHHRAAFRL
jgi:MFS family permease